MSTKDLKALANLLGMSYQDIKYIYDEITIFIETMRFEFYLRIITNIITILTCILIVIAIYNIKKYCRLIYLKLYGFEDNYENEEDEENNYNFAKTEKTKIEENINQEEEFSNLVESLDKEKIELIIMGILIGLIIIIIMLKIIL